MIDPNNLPEKKEMAKYLKETLPKLKPRARKLAMSVLKGMYKTKRISKEQYEEALEEFEKLGGKK